MVYYRKDDTLKVHFPFSEKEKSKIRPAVVISCDDFNYKTRNVTVAMITSAQFSSWPLDTEIFQIQNTGLERKSFIRMKFVSLEPEMIVNKIGELFISDRKRLESVLEKFHLS